MTTISGDTGVDKFEGTTIAGHVIQVANYTTGAMATGTALIPVDDTIPQITEGFQVMSLAFTPKRANSVLKITVVNSCFYTTVTDLVSTCLFDVASNSCIGMASNFLTTTTGASTSFIVFVPVSSILTKTYTVRMGGVNAGTRTFNGSASTAYFGGSLASSITIEEIAQ